MTEPEKTMVLGADVIRNKIIRMAYEIVENNGHEKSLVIAGIDGQGYTLAKMLVKELKKISAQEMMLVRIGIDKKSPETSEVTLDAEPAEMRRKAVVLVDDVLNTGRIIFCSMRPFQSMAVKKMEVAVLVNRSHLLFPVQASYTGYALATTLTDHIEVVLDKNPAVYLH